MTVKSPLLPPLQHLLPFFPFFCLFQYFSLCPNEHLQCPMHPPRLLHIRFKFPEEVICGRRLDEREERGVEERLEEAPEGEAESGVRRRKVHLHRITCGSLSLRLPVSCEHTTQTGYDIGVFMEVLYGFAGYGHRGLVPEITKQQKEPSHHLTVAFPILP
ncbi:hypothetical protein BDP27DRAFT_1373539 [Rhodocollybia butyracea]|uniref:Uncharacterized protein n=1 Tax=Rhodocollybia butyracea TaxID=206335 RepID=A0A9P5P783_9AGAR|nr:hypothetical protein BDP27DRAFT_1373539 [Rhodocollybia butyracea]